MADIQYSAFEGGNRDPIQGHDVLIKTRGKSNGQDDGVPQNGFDDTSFTDILVKIVNQSEAILILGSRNPRYADGENIIVYSMSGPMTSLKFIGKTFGNHFAGSLKKGRKYRTPRHSRFDIDFKVDIPNGTPGGEQGFNNDEFISAQGVVKHTEDKITLGYCRCDTLSFGVAAGKGYAVQTWQGTAESLDAPDDPVTNK